MQSSVRKQYLEFCQQLLQGRRGTQVELRESFAATMALANDREDALFIISKRDDAHSITGHTVADERRFASTRELAGTEVLPNLTAFLIHLSWLPH